MSKWTGELRLVAIDTDRVVFHRDPNDEMSLTIGQRYAVAIVELDDHENLAPEKPERQAVKRTVRQPSNVAAILAKNQGFQRFAAMTLKHRGEAFLPANEETATEFIRRTCSVSSRAELDGNMGALQSFHEIELEFYRWEREQREPGS